MEKLFFLITDDVYINTFQFLTLNYRLISLNFWSGQCALNRRFFYEYQPDLYLPKLVNWYKQKNNHWNENFLQILLGNKALLETLYINQEAKVQIIDAQHTKLLRETNFFDAVENEVLGHIDENALTKNNRFTLSIKEEKNTNELTIIQLDLDDTYLNLVQDLSVLNTYIDQLKDLSAKTLIIFNTQRTFFDTFDYMLYFLFRYQQGFYVCCNDGTCLYHFDFSNHQAIWTKVLQHPTKKMFLQAVKNKTVKYDLIFDEQEFFTTPGYADGLYPINQEWSIAYYCNDKCNKHELVQKFLDQNYANQIKCVLNIDDKNDSTMFLLNLKKSNCVIKNYTVQKKENISLTSTVCNLHYLANDWDWICKINYEI